VVFIITLCEFLIVCMYVPFENFATVTKPELCFHMLVNPPFTIMCAIFARNYITIY